jgi:hypothetical protein
LQTGNEVKGEAFCHQTNTCTTYRTKMLDATIKQKFDQGTGTSTSPESLVAKSTAAAPQRKPAVPFKSRIPVRSKSSPATGSAIEAIQPEKQTKSPVKDASTGISGPSKGNASNTFKSRIPVPSKPVPAASTPKSQTPNSLIPASVTSGGKITSDTPKSKIPVPAVLGKKAG